MKIVLRIIRNVFPPFILQILKKLKPSKKYGWVGIYKDWDQVAAITKGYSSEAIFDRVIQAGLHVRNGDAAFERDGKIFYRKKYNYALLSSFFYISCKKANKLSIIDFGGSVGSLYYLYKDLLSSFELLKWNIVEQSKLVDKVKSLFEDDNLQFFYTIEESKMKCDSSTLMLSSTLQYLKEPYNSLLQFFVYKFDFIIIERTPVTNCCDNFVTMQIMNPDYSYQGSYPCWIFNEKWLIETILPNYSLVFEFHSGFPDIYIDDNLISFKGYFFERIK